MLFHTQILNNTQYYSLARNTFCAKNLKYKQTIPSYWKSMKLYNKGRK